MSGSASFIWWLIKQDGLILGTSRSGGPLTLCPSCPDEDEWVVPKEWSCGIAAFVGVADEEDGCLFCQPLLLMTTVLGPRLGFWIPSTLPSRFLVAGGVGIPMLGREEGV